ncbi:toll-like receptor 2 [Toxotes jaculatrix]|uniref:toll-like receptor 2 n=1 Tax=Toxotes jaculatrix TaxID=941984 RepID=UPI001B3AC439|nr:toll-like receptor 2 [Toxotes jaculatrix]
MKTRTFLTLILLLMRQSFSLCRPQCHICEQTMWNCSRQNLREVPVAPSVLITELDLSFNRLETIMKDDFLAYGGLRSLILTRNKIKTIHELAFDPLIDLEKLDLSLNQLNTLCSRWFKNLCSLQYLNLLGNNYKTLGQGNLFQPLKKLKTLYFGGLYLRSVRKGDFSGLRGLEELFIDGKKLQDYAQGSLRQIGPISQVTLGLNGPFMMNLTLVEVLLSDVVHPNTTLTFTDTWFFSVYQMLPFKVVYTGGTTGLAFKNVNITISAGAALLHHLSDSSVTMLTVEDTNFQLRSLDPVMSVPDMDHLQSVVVKNVNVPQFYSFPALLVMHPLLKVARRFTVLNSKFFALPCQSSALFSKPEYIDISGNILSDFALSEMMCYGKGVLWNLQTINVSRNHLLSINSQLFTKLNKLENIDMSGNAFHSMPETCNWPLSLRFLNLSSAHLTRVTSCLPQSLRILDLSNNDFTVFNIELPFLRELYISGNKIGSLPDGGLYPRLVSLSIRNNNLQTFSDNNLNDYNNLKSLEAAYNTYVCSCDFVAFMTSDLTKHRVRIRDDLKSYICDSPDTARGQSVADVSLSVFECHKVLSSSLLCSGILAVFLLIAGLCHKFSVVWYMRMTWTWLRAKRKPKLKEGELEYDAFVSYSEMDSGWVEAHLVPELEQSEPPLRLCLHKRDFVPGGWIVDNIMDAIERSHKTLFILSQHFVRSEWCKYELDYTHFRLFEQNDDRVVLILLEPIDKKAIPKKFCKLRRVMNSRTYLEWPGDDDQIARFWQSLRTAIERPVTDDGSLIDFTGNLII